MDKLEPGKNRREWMDKLEPGRIGGMVDKLEPGRIGGNGG